MSPVLIAEVETHEEDRGEKEELDAGRGGGKTSWVGRDVRVDGQRLHRYR